MKRLKWLDFLKTRTALTENIYVERKPLAHFLMTITIALFAGHSPVGHAGSLYQGFTYEGRLFNAAGTAPILDNNVQFTLQILSPTGCLLYEEIQTADTTTTAGRFELQVGSDVTNPKRSPANDPGLPMSSVFANLNSQLRAPAADCAGGALSSITISTVRIPLKICTSS